MHHSRPKPISIGWWRSRLVNISPTGFKYSAKTNSVQQKIYHQKDHRQIIKNAVKNCQVRTQKSICPD